MAKARLQPWALLVILLSIVCQSSTFEDSETIHIIQSTWSPCPGELTGEPCLTFSEYLRGDYRQYYVSDPSEIVLEFQPGRHTIGRFPRGTVTIASQLSSFRMNSNYSTNIFCTSEGNQNQIANVQSVHISGIDFVQCRLQSESVMNFILEESSLSQLQNNFRFTLSEYLSIQSSSATIIGCNFTNNDFLPLRIDNSSVEIHHTNFVNNARRGALLIENTNIVTISHCSFINNRASNDGGVGSIRNATVSIRNSTFSNNRAGGDGGVFAVDNSEITIYGSTFNNNTAETNGGVISINFLRSALFISHTSFTNNEGSNQGGVMYLRRKGSRVKISRSTIGSNSATRGGFATVRGSSLKITTSNILDNTADTGDVISACSSDISVSDQFTIGTDPDHSVCTLFSGNVNDIDLIEATTTEAQIDTTTTRATIETTTSQPIETASVYFELNGKAYPNNSIISLLEVGENQNALLCKTDLVTCCGTPPNRFGEFYYPNGEAVPVRSAEHGFYRDRRAQVVRLNRREGVTSPTGKFHCAVPDANGTIRNLFINLV